MSDEKSDSIEASITEVPAENATCIPPIKFQRNEYGLICNRDIKYIYNPDGTIDWRKMVNPKFLVANKQIFERKGKSVPPSIEGLDDRELLILLGGIKELAQIRGYSKVKHVVTAPNSNYVVSVCHITFLPNFETENKEITFSAIGDAGEANTTSFTRNYLGPIAENRAFVRCVRNFLKINIVSQEEVGGSIVSEDQNIKLSTSVLQETMDKHGITFALLKDKLVSEKYVDPSGKAAQDYANVNDIPSDKQFELVSRIKKKAKSKEAPSETAKIAG